ncbi:hypothetical protein J2848_000635 [Azospirillum lipoferum]|uniref:Transmembrane protein n=1 Tax=Azospirillum lipoferum TaxID=193 RepID=A0A5A9GI54_AZOLI|nr:MULTISPECIES: hypothetical protein [Azospirillum]KAA0593535.1 hypothetical protein FZ942_24170 [Azospirillum lipoferum]MCP1608999.1 hypothetical protein [Azospirillum lipoferum]MDW5535688.1 hypothetical protein [Azospirillum sp. NL1]
MNSTLPPGAQSHPASSGRPSQPRRLLSRLFRPLAILFAVGYFLLDALAYWVVRPVVGRFARLPLFTRFGRWVAGLGPYPSLVLVLVPLALLEPAKPVGAWLFATGRPMTGAAVIVGAELVKITLVERLFHIAKPKLLTIGWFVWGYVRVTAWLTWLKDAPPLRTARRMLGAVREFARRVGQRLSLMVRRAGRG